MDMKKFECALDVFKGTCELNNYNLVSVTLEEGKNTVKPEIKGNKSYYYSVVLTDKMDYIMGAVNTLEPDTFQIGELINMASKVLYNLDIDDIHIEINSNNNEEELVSNLEALDLDVEISSNKASNLSFSINVEDKNVINGGVEDDKIYFELHYSDLEKVYTAHEKNEGLDVYVYPMDKESLSDAFILGSNLKDAGFKTEIDYSLKQVDKSKLNASFMISFNKDDIKKYEVKFIDLATNEVKTVGIDNLIEELAFI